MTMTAWFTVTDITEDIITAVADAAGDKVRPYANRSELDETTKKVEVDPITSNTEGKLTKIEVTMHYDPDTWDGQLKVGDVFNLTGHFGG